MPRSQQERERASIRGESVERGERGDEWGGSKGTLLAGSVLKREREGGMAPLTSTIACAPFSLLPYSSELHFAGLSALGESIECAKLIEISTKS